MSKHRLLVAVAAIVISPWLVNAQNKTPAQAQIKVEKDASGDKDKDKDGQDKSVPAPNVLALLAAGASVAGVTYWRQRQRRET